MLVLSIGVSKTSNAVQQQCVTFYAFCGSGTYFTFTICGDDPNDFWIEQIEHMSHFAEIKKTINFLCGNYKY